MSVSETLKRARQILEDPNVWIKGDLARDADSRPCKPTSPLAKRFDIAGAIEAAAFRLYAHDSFARRAESGYSQAFHTADMLCLRLLRTLLPGSSSIAAFNDHKLREHAHVLKLLDHAIAVAEAEERAASTPPAAAQAAAAQ